MQLSVRQKEILKILSQSNNPVKVKQLSGRLKVSERTIRYDLDKIEYFLKKIETKIEEKKEIVKKEIVKEKVEPKKSIKALVENSSNEMTKGYFIQIGAFRKKPSDSYITNIRNANLKYKIYQVDVKGTLYNKVLIGPYSSRALANENIDNIKKKLNLSSAYILKF